MSTRVLKVAGTKQGYPNNARGREMINDKRTIKRKSNAQKDKNNRYESRREERGRRTRKEQNNTGQIKKYDVREEERLCKKLKQLIAAHRLLSYPSPSFLVLIQPSTLHHGGHNLEGLGGIDRNVVQKFGNR